MMHAAQHVLSTVQELCFSRIVFAICPTGNFCREDRCQSYFKFDLIPTMRAPLEECESAGAIRDVGGAAFIIDAPAAKMSELEFTERIRNSAPDLIVVVVTFGTLDADIAYAKKLKTFFPKVPIGLRGAPCYVLDTAILTENAEIDFCVRGDYELVFAAIAQHGFEGSIGTTYRRNGSVVRPTVVPTTEDLDTLPFPDRTSLDPSLYRVRGFRSAQATVRVQRGCPYTCTYCLVHTVSGSRARHRSSVSIVREIQEVMKSGVHRFYLRADTFTLNRAWALEICDAIARECPGVRWVTTTRAERVDDELLMHMARSGCYGISFGLDVASSTIAQHVKKYTDRDMAQNAMRLCDKHGILSLAYLMIGFLWETSETLQENSEFIRLIRPDLLTIHFAHPYPGTVYYDDVMRERFQVSSMHAQAEPAGGCAGVSIEDLKNASRGMLFRHYARPKVLWSLARKLQRNLKSG